MAKFKVGDKVRILDGSKIKNYVGSWNSSMNKHVDEVHTIVNVDKDSLGRLFYSIEGNMYRWDERGLELAYKFKVGDKVIGNVEATKHYWVTEEGWIGTVIEVLNKPGPLRETIRVEGPGWNGPKTKFFVSSEYFDLYIDHNKKIVITTDGKTTTAVLYDGKQRIKEAKAKCASGDEFDFNMGASLALDRLTGFVRGSVESTLDTRSQMDRFIAGEIVIKVTDGEQMRFLVECEKRGLRWHAGQRATRWGKGYQYFRVINGELGFLYEKDAHKVPQPAENWDGIITPGEIETDDKETSDTIDFAKIFAMAAMAKFLKELSEDD